LVFNQLKILIISTEKWGINKLSKHHYALELARRNNQVYFLNPSEGELAFSTEQTEHKNLTVVNFPNCFAGLNRIQRISFLFNALQRLQINSLKKKLGIAFDVVWSFDPHRFQNLNLFDSRVTIFHPVDFFKTELDLVAARHAKIIFSVSSSILERYASINPNRFVVNHGVSADFFENFPPSSDSHKQPRCGYVGNLLSFGIHHANLLKIVTENTQVHFHFIGPFTNSNLGRFKNSEVIEQLQHRKNTTFHGPVESRKVAAMIHDFDLFLVCYDPELGGSIGVNNHKILEYLSTGKVVVSSYLSAYDTLANGMFEMSGKNAELPDIFKKTVNQIDVHNSPQLQQKRKAFARLNSYENHLQIIQQLITEHVTRD
jgi:glycosyltransferase involved in cell wall biosynthesis